MELEGIIIFFLMLLGLAFGSFFNVVIYRLPENKSLIPSSKCPTCGKSIPFWLNIPILSWIVLGGKCKYCKSPIKWHYLIVEFITPIIYLLVYLKFNDQPIPIILKYLVFFSYGNIILFIDIYHMRIPFKLSIPLIVLGILTNLIPQNDISLVNSLIGGGGSFLFFTGLMVAYYYIRGKDGLGFGDVLLLTAIGFFTGINSLAFILVFASIVGVIVMSAVMKYGKDKLFPFGPFLVLASWIYILWAHKYVDLYFEYMKIFIKG